MESQKKQAIEYLAKDKIAPLLKWPGGKTSELKVILPNLPATIDRYFEPFWGGGAVYFALSEKIPSIVNDKSDSLIDFYNCVSRGDSEFFLMLDSIQLTWRDLELFVSSNQKQLIQIYLEYARKQTTKSKLEGLVDSFIASSFDEITDLFQTEYYYDLDNIFREMKRNLISKIDRMSKIEKRRGDLSKSDIVNNFEGTIKSSFYMHLRHLYNYPEKYSIQSSRQSAIFYFIREYAYAAMFRFNRQGKFNVPYGGIGYNRKDMSKKITRLRSQEVQRKLKNTKIECMDFLSFFEMHPPQEDDFVFLDPPYDSDFSDYDRNAFSLDDQARLASFLVNQCKANFMLVIKATEYILSLYERHGLNIKPFDKKYNWTIKERNDRDTTHLMIKNY